MTIPYGSIGRLTPKQAKTAEQVLETFKNFTFGKPIVLEGPATCAPIKAQSCSYCRRQYEAQEATCRGCGAPRRMIPDPCKTCPAMVTSCIGGEDLYLAYQWQARGYHPERRGERCCVLRSHQAFNGYIRVRFADGTFSDAAPKGSARRMPHGAAETAQGAIAGPKR